MVCVVRNEPTRPRKQRWSQLPVRQHGVRRAGMGRKAKGQPESVDEIQWPYSGWLETQPGRTENSLPRGGTLHQAPARLPMN